MVKYDFYGYPIRARKRRTKKARGKTAYRKGKRGENDAEAFLTRRKFKIEARRYRRLGMEFDLMIGKGGKHYLVEVKNLSKKVQKGLVEKFHKKLIAYRKKDKSTKHRGIFMSKKGFEASALTTAKVAGIKTFTFKGKSKHRHRSNNAPYTLNYLRG